MYAILWTFVACLTGDYQAVADNMPWTWSEARAYFDYSIKRTALQVDIIELTPPPSLGYILRFRNGKDIDFQWVSGLEGAVFVCPKTTLYIANVHGLGDYDVTAVDLATGKETWQTQLKGIARDRPLFNME